MTDNGDDGHSNFERTQFQGLRGFTGQHVALEDKDDQDDALERLEQELDDDFDLSALREKRLQEMQAEMKQVNELVKSSHGELTEITDEKEVIRISANEKRCVIHFFHNQFNRCEIMNKHLEFLARKYFTTRFVKVFVENVPWLVERLEIKVLPCVICFIGGVTKARLVGFEALGNKDEFQTAALDLWLQQTGVVIPPETPRRTLMGGSSSPPPSSKIRNGTAGDDDDDDWD